jgi:hypothetical protein
MTGSRRLSGIHVADHNDTSMSLLLSHGFKSNTNSLNALSHKACANRNLTSSKNKNPALRENTRSANNDIRAIVRKYAERVLPGRMSRGDPWDNRAVRPPLGDRFSSPLFCASGFPLCSKTMSKFKFTSEMPDEHLFADIQTLNAFSDEQLSQLICMLLNYIIEKYVLALCIFTVCIKKKKINKEHNLR